MLFSHKIGEVRHSSLALGLHGLGENTYLGRYLFVVFLWRMWMEWLQLIWAVILSAFILVMVFVWSKVYIINKKLAAISSILGEIQGYASRTDSHEGEQPTE